MGDYYEEDKYYLIIRSTGLSMAACNGGKEKADNQTEKQTESVKPTEEVAMATEAVTEVTTEAGSDETEKDIAEAKDSEEKTDKEDNRSADNETASKQEEKPKQNDEPEQKAPVMIMRKLAEIRVMQVMVVRLQTVRKTM